MSPKRPETKTEMIALRLPQRLARAIDRHAGQLGVGRSETIRQLLKAALGKADASNDVLGQLLGEVQALRREVRALKGRGGGR